MSTKAMSLLVDRQNIQDFVFGRTGSATPNILNNPARFRSPNRRHEFNVDKANALLDEAGWVMGADGIREKDGVRMSLKIATTTGNQLREQTEAMDDPPELA
mgnify:CR=1 FL=1